jgi:hypothetical protein
VDAKNDESGSRVPSPEPGSELLRAFERTNQLLVSLNGTVHQLAHATAALCAAQEEMNTMLLSLSDSANDEDEEGATDLSGHPIRTS